MRKMQKIAALGLAGTMALSLAACGGSGDSTADSASTAESTASSTEATAESTGSGDEAVTLNWALWDKDSTAYWQALADGYMESHPNVTIEMTDLGSTDYMTQLATQLAGGNGELDVLSIKDIPGYSNLIGMLEPLSGKLTTDESKFNGVLEQLTAEDGNYYAVPFRSDFWVVYYNKDIFDQAGVEYPTNDMTMADFDAKIREVYEKTGYKTDVFYGNGADYCAYVLRGEGGHLYNGSEIGATEEQIEAFFDIYETGIAEGWACDPAIYAERTIGTPEQMPLVYGSSPSTMSWCSFTWSNALSALQNAAGDNFTIEMTTWPSKDPKTSDYLKPSMFFCITADSTQPGEAAKLLNYWTNDVDANKTLLGERGIPVSSETANGIKDLLDTSSQKAVDFVNNVVTPNSTPIDAPSPEGSAEVIQQVNQLVEKVCYGELTAKEAAAQLLSAGNAALNK